MSTGTQRAANAANDQAKKRPVDVIRRYIGGANVDIAIFEKENRTPGRNGGVFTRYTHFVTVTKSWKKKRDEGQNGPAEYNSGSAFNPHELLVLADAIRAAYDRCLELDAEKNGNLPEEESF